MIGQAVNRIPWWSATGLALLVYALASADFLPGEASFAVLLVVMLSGVTRLWVQLSAAQRRTLLLLLGLSVCIAVLPTWLNLHALPIPLVAGRLATVCVGWSVVLWLPLETGVPKTAPAWRPRAWQLMLLLGMALALTSAKHALMVGRFAVLQDEVLYLLQSSWLRGPHFGWRIEPELLQFFRPEYTAYRDGILTTQYPPGWPALLAFFSALGLRWWSTAILAVTTIWFTFLLGRELKSAAVGFIAATLLALQSWLVESAHGYMSQGATLATSTCAAYLLIRGESSAARKQITQWLVAGVLLGYAVAVRPLSGLAVAASLLLWLLVRGRSKGRGNVLAVVCVMLGALLPIAGLLYYNDVTNGNPFVLGYQAVHGHYHDLGFGARGYRYFAGGITPASIAAKPFTVVNAIVNLGQRLWEFSSAALPLFLLIPVTWFATVNRFRIEWRTVSAFLLLPLAYFFYFFTNIRFYAELLPFLMIGVAGMLWYLLQQRPVATSRALLPVILIASLVASLSTRSGEHARPAKTVLSSAAAIEKAARQHGKVVVFLYDPTWEAYLFRRLAFFNEKGLESHIIVARDRGSADQLLVRRLPEHTPLRGEWDGRAGRLRLVPLGRASPP